MGVGLVELPNLEELMLDVGRALGPWTYLLVGILAFLETGAFVGLVAPGETTVIVGGVVAGQGEISLYVLIGIVWACAVAGDLASYTAGRKLGRAWLLRHGERVKITEDRLHKVEEFFERRGGTTILVGRFIGFVRALAPFIAGTSNMPLRRFLPYDVLGAGAWAATFSTLGYVFWQSFDKLTTYVSRGLFAFGTVVAVVVAIVFLVQLRRDPDKRERVRAWLEERQDRRGWRADRAARRPGLAARRTARGGRGRPRRALRVEPAHSRPARARADDAARAAWPWAASRSSSSATSPRSRGCRGSTGWARTWRRGCTCDRLVEVAKVVTELGSLPVAGAVVLVTAAWSASKRRWGDAVTLVVGMALTFVLVHVAKAAYDRARPSNPLVDAELDAYPSGHTAYAVAWVACAVVLVRAGTGWAVRFAAVTVAIVLVAVVAATRVYLRVHYLTDTIGGAALAVAIWALVAVLVLVGGHVRHNARRVA